MSFRRFGILGMLAVLPVVAQVYNPPTEAPRLRHGLARDVRVRPDGSMTSTNWSGYIVSGAAGSVTDAKGSWIVPAIPCSGSESTYSSFWVGIDGSSSGGTLEQIGTSSECDSGTANYYAWYEFLPQDPVGVEITGLTVSPGDVISAEVSYSRGQFTVTITDVTTGVTAPAIPPTTVAGAARSSAEWIAEDPATKDGIILPLANFGLASYGIDNTGVVSTCNATVGTKSGAIGNLPRVSAIKMVSSLNGNTEAVPTPLSPDGSSFSVTGQPFTTLWSFDETNGLKPNNAPLVEGMDGSLYGTTSGWTATDGTIFKITTGGTPSVLHSFIGTDGSAPEAGLALASDGNFYGTTYGGGSLGDGTVFEITPEGTLNPLHVFSGPDGKNPFGTLTQGTNGEFYGTTEEDGAGWGTIFKVSAAGSLTTLYSFTNTTDGGNPQTSLVYATDGNFYGTASSGGANGGGTIFRITPGGKLTTIYGFSGGTDGSNPNGLMQATNGNFYGTTQAGANGYGTVFRLTSKGAFTTLHTFLNSTDGATPESGLVQATDGNLYGTTVTGGSGGGGTLFEFATRSALLTTLYSFSGPDGANPAGALAQATDGNLYGTTYVGGAGYGTVFKLNIGLGPFIETLPASDKVGKPVKILGTNLLGATSVAFNGKAAAFTVVSNTEISTKVPTGATTGKVKVITPGGTLLSNVSFRVTK